MCGMRRLILLIAFLIPAALAAENWTPYPDAGCIGGSTCGGRRARLKIRLEQRPVVGIRFFARDDIGERAGGTLRVKVGDTIVKDDIDVHRQGSVITIDVEAVRGNTLTIEPSSDDEVKIERVEVLYGSPRIVTRDVTQRPMMRPGRDGWQDYPEEGRCIGGRECRQNGKQITIVLEDRPVAGVRLHAQDDIGARADGRLKLRIDDEVIAAYVDVERRGRVHEFEVDNIYGSKLVIETANDDEVDVKNIAVLYGRDRERPRGGGWKRGGGIFDEKGGCIGGDECGGSRAQIRVRLKDRPVLSISFYAHDDVGTRANGQLRVRIDDDILEDYIDIRREGKSHTIQGKKKTGAFLYIEPIGDDEVVVDDIRVRYEQ
jgi:hypothetical protein